MAPAGELEPPEDEGPVDDPLFPTGAAGALMGGGTLPPGTLTVAPGVEAVATGVDTVALGTETVGVGPRPSYSVKTPS